ncbi:MAG: AI-2E family transporter [Campylobacterota bacterium]
MDTKGLPQLLGFASVIIILAGLKSAEMIVIPIMLAFFIAIISTPFVRLMSRYGVPNWIAIIVVLFVIFIVGGILSLIVSQSLNSFLEKLPMYQKKLEAMVVGLAPLLESMNIPVSRQMLVDAVNPSSVMNIMGSTLSTVKSFVTSAFLVIFIVIFILMEEATLPKKFKAALPDANGSMDAAKNFIGRVNKYLLIKTSISFVTGVLITGLLMVLGVDFPILWGVIAMLMNFIPNVGSLIAAIPPVLLATVQLSIPEAGLVALGYAVVNVGMGNLIEPRLMGKGLGLSPLVVFLSLIIWGWLFGVVGMFLSIPLTMIVKIALEQHPGTLWIAIMLGNETEPVAKIKQEQKQLGRQ